MFYGIVYGVAHGAIGFEFLHAGFGKSTTDKQSVDRGQIPILQRVDFDQLGAGCTKRVEIALVIKAEGAVARDTDAQSAKLGLAG